MTNEKTIYGKKLWDEILKAVVATMPEQLFPVFEEVYGKHYPKGTSIQLISTEHSTYEDNVHATPSSRLMDIALLIGGTDYYHIECEIKNTSLFIVRMIAYDLHFAMQHCIEKDSATGEITMHFPRSFVLYPGKNDAIPDTLRCHIFFQDGSEHIYQIPTVKIQPYSLEEIKEKHLTLFLPYLLLRLRPHIQSANPLTKNELTAFVASIIVILEEEMRDGYLTEKECSDYINLFQKASAHVFYQHPEYHEEVLRMTEPLIKLPSMIAKEMAEDMAKDMAEEMAKDIAKSMATDMAQDIAKSMAIDMAKNMAEDMANDIAKNMANGIAKDMAQDMANEQISKTTAQYDALLAKKDSEIAHLQQLLAEKTG